MHKFTGRISQNGLVQSSNVYPIFGDHKKGERDIDPLTHPRIKEMLVNYFSSGCRRIWLSPTLQEGLANSPTRKPQGVSIQDGIPAAASCWADDLPKKLRQAYGLYAPAINIRMPRLKERHEQGTYELFREYRHNRYYHILTCAWASDLPLTKDIMKNLLDPWFQETFERTIELFEKTNSISYDTEDWSDTPLWYGKSTDDLHIRPTRQCLYTAIEAVVFLYDSVTAAFGWELGSRRFKYETELTELFNFENWIDYKNPMPNKTNEKISNRKPILER